MSDTNLDLREAERLMRQATTDDDRALALKFQAEGVRNLIQSGLADPFIRAVAEIVERQFGKLETRLDNSDEARLTRNTQFQTELDARLDAFAEKQDAMLTVVQDGAARLGKIEQDIAGLKDSQGESLEDRAEIHHEIAGLRAEVADLRTTVGGYMAANRRAELTDLQHKIADLEARLAANGGGDAT